MKFFEAVLILVSIIFVVAFVKGDQNGRFLHLRSVVVICSVFHSENFHSILHVRDTNKAAISRACRKILHTIRNLISIWTCQFHSGRKNRLKI